jgi:hypothetical protein
MPLHPIPTSWFCEKTSLKSPVTTGARAGVHRIVLNRMGMSMSVQERNIHSTDRARFSRIFNTNKNNINSTYFRESNLRLYFLPRLYSTMLKVGAMFYRFLHQDVHRISPGFYRFLFPMHP